MSFKKWNMDNPEEAQAAVEYLFSLPDDEYISEYECDLDALDVSELILVHIHPLFLYRFI